MLPGFFFRIDTSNYSQALELLLTFAENYISLLPRLNSCERMVIYLYNRCVLAEKRENFQENFYFFRKSCVIFLNAEKKSMNGHLFPFSSLYNQKYLSR